MDAVANRTVTCSKCKELRLVGKPCKPCAKRYLKEWNARPENLHRKRDYSRKVRAKPGYREYRNKIEKVWRAKNPEKLRDKEYKHLYGLTIEEVEQLKSAQNNACAICNILLPDKPGKTGWHVDHDHNTGKVRGILCARCNHGLGRFKDNVAILNNAILYLTKNG